MLGVLKEDAWEWGYLRWHTNRCLSRSVIFVYMIIDLFIIYFFNTYRCLCSCSYRFMFTCLLSCMFTYAYACLYPFPTVIHPQREKQKIVTPYHHSALTDKYLFFWKMDFTYLGYKVLLTSVWQLGNFASFHSFSKLPFPITTMWNSEEVKAYEKW